MLRPCDARAAMCSIPAAQFSHFFHQNCAAGIGAHSLRARAYWGQIHYMANPTALDALHNMPFAVWLRTSAYAYPTVEIVHLSGIALLLGTVFLVDVRLAGFRAFGLANFPAMALSKAVLPWTLIGFLIASMSGFMLFLARASEHINNRAFILKMVLLCVAGTNAAMLHARGGVTTQDGLTRAQALFSILVWLGILACGRMIAFV
jgi:hypothetical protein